MLPFCKFYLFSQKGRANYFNILKSLKSMPINEDLLNANLVDLKTLRDTHNFGSKALLLTFPTTKDVNLLKDLM